MTEPEWDEEQQALIVALMEYESDKCSGCGMPLSETTKDVLDKDGNADPVASMQRYQAKPDERCYSCAAIHEAQAKSGDYMNPESLLLSVYEKKGVAGNG